MKDTARLIATLTCGRNCDYCPNIQYIKQARQLEALGQLFKYNAVCITGGEPLLEFAIFQTLLDDLRHLKPSLKLYLYASTFITLDNLKWAVANTDGITWTIHKGATAFDGIKLDIVQRSIDADKHNRLVLHTGAQSYWQDKVDYGRWERVTILYMTLDTCLLPDNEDLYILKEATGD